MAKWMTRPGYLLGLLFMINFLNFFDRALPAVVLESIGLEFGLSDTQLGALGAAFVLIYALAGIPLGQLADRHRRLTVMAGGVAVWSLLTAATAMTKNYAALFMIRLGVGVGEASCAPAANSLISDLYPSDRRARAIGIFMLGLPLGTFAAFALGGWLAENYGWRLPFLLAAIPGVILAVLVYMAREPLRGSQEAYKVNTSTPVKNPIRSLMRIPTLWALIASGAALNFATYSMNTFLPTMLTRYHGASITSSGTISAIVLGLTGLIGLTFGGALADAFHRRWPKGRLMLGAISLVVAAPLVWAGLSRPAGDLVTLTILLSASWVLLFFYFVTVYPAIQDVVQPRLRATGMAVYFLFMYILGGGVGTFVTGALSDYLATQAMLGAGMVEMTAHFKAVGLQKSMQLVMPIALVCTGIAIAVATLTYSKDVEKSRAASGQ